MEKFDKLTGTAAPLPMVNVDTDKIIPKQFLKTIRRTGLGKGLFHEMRYRHDGSRIDDFVLHRPEHQHAQILVTGANFGCGSSREHAPWALLDYGIRCVIAPSFADIFHSNCVKNGILLITLPEEDVETLMKDANQAGRLTVDLEAGTITRPGGEVIPFEVDPFHRHCLLHGLDDIGLTLEKHEAIDHYETHARQERPWLFA